MEDNHKKSLIIFVSRWGQKFKEHKKSTMGSVDVDQERHQEMVAEFSSERLRGP